MSFMAGSVFADLVLDDKKWTEGINKAIVDLGRLGEKSKKIGKDVERLGKSMSIAGAAIVGGLGYILKSAANVGDQIAKLSVKVGVSVEDLSSYRLAATLAGASIENLGIGMRLLAMNMQNAKDGLGESVLAFKRVGVSVEDSNGKLRGINDVMLDLADAFSKMEDGTEKAALSQRLLGRSGSELIPLLNLGRKGLMENRKEAEKLGMVFSQKTAKDSEDFNDSLTRLSGAFLGLKQSIVVNLMPYLTQLIEGFKETIAKVTKWVGEHPKLVMWILKLTAALGGLLAVFGPLVFVFGKMMQAFGNIMIHGPKLLGLLHKMGPALAQIAVVAGAAFVGWKIGRAIAELLGLDKHLQNAFTSAFKFLGIIKEVNIEMGEGHAAAEKIQQEAITRAMELSGKSVKNFIEAKRILQAQFKATGATGNEVLDAWLERLPKVVEVTKPVVEVFKSFADQCKGIEKGLKTATEALAEIDKVFKDNIETLTTEGLAFEEIPIEFDFTNLDAQGEEAIGFIDELLGNAKTKAAEVGVAITESMEALRGPTIDDIRQRIALITMTLTKFGSVMPTSQVKALEEEIQKLKETIGDVSPWERFLAGAVEAFNKIESMITPIITQFQRNKEIAIENEYKKRLDIINKTVTDEEKKQQAIIALDAEFEIKKTASKKAAAKTEKAVAMMGAVINTAQAITKALAQGGFILGIPWAAIVGALGAAQVAAIAAQPIPLAEGATFDRPTLLNNVLTGENRPEHLLDEPRLVDIVREALYTPREAFSMPRLAPVPAFAGAASAGTSVTLHMSGPLITTTGVTQRQLEEVAEELPKIINRQLSRVGLGKR